MMVKGALLCFCSWGRGITCFLNRQIQILCSSVRLLVEGRSSTHWQGKYCGNVWILVWIHCSRADPACHMVHFCKQMHLWFVDNNSWPNIQYIRILDRPAFGCTWVFRPLYHGRPFVCLLRCRDHCCGCLLTPFFYRLAFVDRCLGGDLGIFRLWSFGILLFYVTNATVVAVPIEFPSRFVSVIILWSVIAIFCVGFWVWWDFNN